MDLWDWALLVIFVLLLDIRLHKIYKELKIMNEAAGMASIKEQLKHKGE